MRAGVASVIAGLATVLAPSAEATFLGENGRLAISTRIGADTSNEIYTIQEDGTGLARLTDAPGDDVEPNWSADGSRIVFSTRRHDPTPDSACDATTLCERDLYVINADGTGEVRLTSTPGVEERDPAWSPDGTQVAYTARTRLPSGNFREVVALINADGTDPHAVITDELGQTNRVGDPSWSRSGDRIAFTSATAGIGVANVDGTGQRAIDSGIDPNWSHYNGRILYRKGSISVWAKHPDLPFTDELSHIEGRDPVWSPDGRKIASHIADVYMMAADGSDRTLFLETDGITTGIDWQPIPAPPIPGYPRPKGATPLRVPLVLAYRMCTAPDREHGPPLAFGSCSAPEQMPSLATVGTAESNGRPTRSIGSVTLTTLPGDPATGQDEADVSLRLTITDVRRKSDLADYTGGLTAPLQVQWTDRWNDHGLGGPESATVQDGFLAESFVMGVPCTATSDPGEGSTCALSTTADALTGGSVLEGMRATWEIGQVRVYAGGTEDSVFAVQGVFVP